ncbi:YwqG family protein [Anaeromyxobacter terrae]|uniref:YwqG family protein n=1 Tax=Anaeromyxobacter terrae TaxID=2925406 RepID=UPI001F55B64C|nr:YwqG family protein [Anaeromyxobacter sp. SG22]
MVRFAADVLVALLAVILIARALLWWIERRDRTRARPPVPPPGPPLAGTAVPLPARLEPHRAQLEGLLAPAARLEPLAPAPADVARREQGGADAAPAQLGGAPHLPDDVPWPAAPDRPLSFLAELDLAALHARAPEAAAGLPDEGLLLLFYDAEAMPWGLEPADRERFSLLHVPAGAPPRAAPAGATVFPSRRLTPAPVRVLPAADELPGGRFGDDAADEAYVEHACALWGEPDHRVRGFAGWIQSEAREEAALAASEFPTGSPAQLQAARPHAPEVRPADWRLLLQLDSDPAVRFEWGDAGRLYVLARDEDVLARRFDRAWLLLQCY